MGQITTEVQMFGTHIQFNGTARQELAIRRRLVMVIKAVWEENIQSDVCWQLGNPLAQKALEGACEEFSIAVQDLLAQNGTEKVLARRLASLWPENVMRCYDPLSGRLDLAAL